MIKKTFFVVVFCLFGLFIQSSVVHSNFPGLVAPDFILLVVVMIGLQSPGVGGLLAAFLLGLFADVASGVYLGPNAAGCVVAFCLTISIAKRVFAERSFAVASICFWSALAKTSTYLLLVALHVSSDLLTSVTLTKLLMEAFVTALIAPIIYKVLLVKSDKGTRKSTKSVTRSVAYTKSSR